MSRRRGVAPVAAACALIAVTVALAVGVGTAAVALDGPDDRASISAAADAATDRITLVHHGGTVLNLTRLEVRVSVDGDPLAHQPPVPFFAARGFRSGPTGPFNAAASDRWRAGQRTGFRIASTNAPSLDSGDRVRVRLLRGDRLVASATTRAR